MHAYTTCRLHALSAVSAALQTSVCFYVASTAAITECCPSKQPLTLCLVRDLQAAVIIFLASAGAGFITGTNILVDGGWSLEHDAIPTFV
jgi:NAD(P)-dependent dehydrogenase (short-subunit alcohol dehydrogenase family)